MNFMEEKRDIVRLAEHGGSRNESGISNRKKKKNTQISYVGDACREETLTNFTGRQNEG